MVCRGVDSLQDLLFNKPKMCLLVKTCCIIALVVQLELVVGENATISASSSLQERRGRFLTFNTKNDHLEVELKFYVPFISIPVKRTWNFVSGNVANINMAALIFTGGIIVVSSVVMPAILHLIYKVFPTSGIPHEGPSSTSHHHKHRADRIEPLDVSRFFANLERVLTEYNIDTTSCMQKAVCRNVKSSSAKVSHGIGSSKDKFIEAIATNEWVSKYVEGTAIESAITKGLSQINCLEEFNTCRLTQGSIHNFAKEIVKTLDFT